MRVGAMFHAPVERYTTGAPGLSRTTRSMRTAMPGNRLARMLVDDERVPRGEKRTGEGCDHHRVVDIRHHPELDIRGDGECAGLHRIATLYRHGERLPPRRECRREPDVDDTTAVCHDLMVDSRDRHGHLRISDRHRHETAPAAHTRILAGLRLLDGGNDHHAAEHTDPVGAAVAREGSDGRGMTAAPSPGAPATNGTDTRAARTTALSCERQRDSQASTQSFTSSSMRRPGGGSAMVSI
jgi:hypothetical protein